MCDALHINSMKQCPTPLNTLFFSEFNNPDGAGKLKPIDIIDKLTLANKVTVRMSDDYGSNDIVFSLSGSSKAINFVISEVLWDRLKDLDNIRR